MKNRQVTFLFLFAAIAISLLVFTFQYSPKSKHKDFYTIQDDFIVKGYYTPGVSQGDYNFFALESMKKAVLTDIEGKVIKTWRSKQPGPDWYNAELTHDGNVFAITNDDRLEKLAWNGEGLWILPGKFNHDLDILEDGRIIACERKLIETEYQGNKFKVINDVLTIISQNGERLDEISLFPLFKHLVWPKKMTEAYEYFLKSSELDLLRDSPVDLFHLNAVSQLKRDVPGLGNKLDILVSLPFIQAVAVVNLHSKSIVSVHRLIGFDLIHDPQVTPDNKIVILHNNNDKKALWGKERSEVIWYDIASKKVTRNYWGPDQYKFYTDVRGRIQQLNNNALSITISQQGFAIELDEHQDIVSSTALLNKMKELNKVVEIRKIFKKDLDEELLNDLLIKNVS